MPKLTNVFGARLRETRLGMGLSQKDLERRTGFKSTYISSIELGEINATLSTVEDIAAGLNVPPAELLELPSTETHDAPTSESPLSPDAIPGRLSASDCAAILVRIEGLRPEQRAFLFAMLFSDATLFEGYTLPDDYRAPLESIRKAK